MRIPSAISTTTVGRSSRWWSLDRIAAAADAASTSTSDPRSGAVTSRSRRALRRDPPRARVRIPRFEAHQALAAPERVRRARHRLDGQAPPVHVRERVAGEEHQVSVALVDPEREAGSARRVVQLDPREAVRVALEIGEAAVEPRRADWLPLAEVVLGVLDGPLAGRQAAVVRGEHGSSGRAQDERVDATGSE